MGGAGVVASFNYNLREDGEGSAFSTEEQESADRGGCMMCVYKYLVYL